MTFFRLLSLSILLLLVLIPKAQQSATHIFDPELNKLVLRQEAPVKIRELRYKPDGQDFVIVNGKKKFNRALYGTHTAFRVETGDVPEFALYLPRMGGNLSFGLKSGDKTISLNDAAFIESRYRAGSRIYNIKDPLLGKGSLKMTVLAMANAEGMIIRIETSGIPRGVSLTWKFGGASDRRFSREGDLGVDPPDSFDLKAENCRGNQYQLNGNSFTLKFGANQSRTLTGLFPPASKLSTDELPVLHGSLTLSSKSDFYMMIRIPEQVGVMTYTSLKNEFAKAEANRQNIAGSLKINTPDPFFNTLGGAIATAADGIWDGTVWLHGAVGWRMPLSGWRAAYTGDVLGWHDRSRIHFDAYAASQVTKVEALFPHPNMDSALNLARAVKNWGTQMYSNGYICRNPNRNDQMHHYDMNLAYIDELLWHFNWTGDMDYVKKMWPVLKLHLAWEKRNFDPDGDGLYNAYACIWASDALYYNSGGVTHSSAYNYRANKMAAMIAEKIGEDSKPYKQEADKILNAINAKLWLQNKGHWAEFIDFMGDKMVHESAAIWSVYHSIDSDIHDAYQAYQATRYVDNEIPHIAVEAKGIDTGKYQVISTTNWLPYSWSINNVAIAEINHMALAYWQAGRSEKAFNLLKSSVLDNMYLGSSPGNVGQISYYDAARGECYRDFGDPVGITSRAVVQGLFGILPDAMNNRLVIKPGFPSEWNYASFDNATVGYDFKTKGLKTVFNIRQQFSSLLETELIIPIRYDRIKSLKINGKTVKWKHYDEMIGRPAIVLTIPAAAKATVELIESGKLLNNDVQSFRLEKSATLKYESPLNIAAIYDPQSVLSQLKMNKTVLTGVVSGLPGHRTFFVKVSQGDISWTQPVYVEITTPEKPVIHPFISVDAMNCETISLQKIFNDKVTQVFKNQYLSPRSPYTTLQIPVQGIGEWCHPTLTADIDDSGLRKLAGANNKIETPFGFSFLTPAEGNNIAFTSLWDNFPRKIEIPLQGKASKAYLMLAGTTNHMQCHIDNGYLTAHYADGSKDTLKLITPENWCPIEQDYYVDGQAFRLKTLRPYRIHLKSGLISNNLEKDLKISGVYGRRIDGGAGVLLEMPLQPEKELKAISIEAKANEVIIGLMALTLQR
jgi:hypothetical protein